MMFDTTLFNSVSAEARPVMVRPMVAEAFLAAATKIWIGVTKGVTAAFTASTSLLMASLMAGRRSEMVAVRTASSWAITLLAPLMASTSWSICCWVRPLTAPAMPPAAPVVTSVMALVASLTAFRMAL